MRTLAAALTTAQQAKSGRIAYVQLYLGSDLYISTTGTHFEGVLEDDVNRIAYGAGWQEQFGGIATFRILNNDHIFNTHFSSFKGQPLSIGFGYFCGISGSLVSLIDSYKIFGVRNVSIEGKDYLELDAYSSWTVMDNVKLVPVGAVLTGTLSTTAFVLGEVITSYTAKTAIVSSVDTTNGKVLITRQSALWENGVDTSGTGAGGATITTATVATNSYGTIIYNKDKTGKQIIDELLTTFMPDWSSGGSTRISATLDSDDAEKNIGGGGTAPNPMLSYDPGTVSVASVIRQILSLSKCGIKAVGNPPVLHIAYQDPAAATTYTYSLETHQFSIAEGEEDIIIPNKIIVVDKLPSTNPPQAATYVGIATDTISYPLIGGCVDIIVDGSVTSNATAQAKAEAIIANRLAQSKYGKIVVPMNCGQEVTDMVTVTDTRSGFNYQARVSRIDWEFDPAVNIYQQILTLGGANISVAPLPSGPGGNADPPPVITPPILLPVPPPVITWDSLLPKAVQGYDSTVVFTVVDRTHIAWSAGTLKFHDGTTQAISANASYAIPGAGVYCVYFDLNDATPATLKTVIYSGYQAVLTKYTDVLAICEQGSSTWIPATVFPSRGKIPYITADHISLNGIISGIDTAGTAYSMALSTQISSGNLKLTSTTVKDGDWYDCAGVDINATTGIHIYGTDSAFTTSATKGGTVQCKVGSDGAIYAGAGNVKLDSTGITIKTGVIYFLDSNDVNCGVLCGETGSGLVLQSLNSKNLIIKSATGWTYLYGAITAGGLALDQNNVYSCGSSGQKWSNMYGVNIYSDNLYVENSEVVFDAGGITWNGHSISWT
jgi:hypothetical protein